MGAAQSRILTIIGFGIAFISVLVGSPVMEACGVMLAFFAEAYTLRHLVVVRNLYMLSGTLALLALASSLQVLNMHRAPFLALAFLSALVAVTLEVRSSHTTG